MLMTGGQAVVETLDAWGVDVVFGIPGVHTLALYDALYEHPRIRHVTTRHEQGAGFMADGYARASGRVGVDDDGSGGGECLDADWGGACRVVARVVDMQWSDG